MRSCRALIDLGHTRVRPLAGGFEAWVSAGYQVDAEPAGLG